jgi:acyl-CoA synthetase (AMP-forming)/AMP-acid ligase II
MPIGTVGELLIEGPVVGDGYLNNPEKTAEVFITHVVPPTPCPILVYDRPGGMSLLIVQPTVHSDGPYAITTWVVDPSNHDRLMPIGTVGELLIEGPVVGDGYLMDPPPMSCLRLPVRY